MGMCGSSRVRWWWNSTSEFAFSLDNREKVERHGCNADGKGWNNIFFYAPCSKHYWSQTITIKTQLSRFDITTDPLTNEGILTVVKVHFGFPQSSKDIVTASQNICAKFDAFSAIMYYRLKKKQRSLKSVVSEGSFLILLLPQMSQMSQMYETTTEETDYYQSSAPRMVIPFCFTKQTRTYITLKQITKSVLLVNYTFVSLLDCCQVQF